MKKDFKAIAEIVQKSNIDINNCEGQIITKNNIGEKLADYFATQNPKFDRERFMGACGL